MAPNTSFVLVPGAWHLPACFDALAARLRAGGCARVRAVALPSVGADPGLADFGPDVAAVRAAIRDECDGHGHDVVLLMHSYGGIPGTEACRGLVKRPGGGGGAGVVALVYCAAFMLDEGSSLASALGGTMAPWVLRRAARPDLADVDDAPAVFYNDVRPAAAARAAAAALVRPHSIGTFASPLTYAAWRDVPQTWYILCTDDRAIPLAGQEAMVARVGADRVRTVRLAGASHSPFLSVPDEVAAVCRRAAGEEV